MRPAFFAALAAAVAFAACAPVHADVTITQKTVIDAPGVKQMLKEIPEERRGPLLGMMSPMLTGTPWITTTYMKGSRMREDMGQTTVIVNSKSGKAVTMDNQTHHYSIGPYDPFQKAAGDMTCHIEPTSETAGMLGHIVHKYAVTMTATVLSKATITGEIWAAQDLPTPPSAGYLTGNAAGFESEMSKIKGMPLAYKLVYANTPAGTITVTSMATSIKENAVEASAFQIPSGYAKGTTRVATTTPSAGFPLGDGMPLDSTSPVTDQMATGDMGSIAGALGGSGGTGDMSQLLGNMSPGQLQQLLGSLGGSAGAGSGANALSGMSPAQLQQMLGSLQGAGGTGAGASDGGGLSGLVNPQMLQQLSSMMQQMTSDDDQ